MTIEDRYLMLPPIATWVGARSGRAYVRGMRQLREWHARAKADRERRRREAAERAAAEREAAAKADRAATLEWARRTAKRRLAEYRANADVI